MLDRGGAAGARRWSPKPTLRVQLPAPLLALLAALFLAAPAAAAPFTPELQADYAAAEAWWGRTPTGCSSVTAELVPLGALGEGVEGRATQPLPGEVLPCGIWIEENPMAGPCTTREVVFHEYGHLLGEGHSADPRSIMALSPPGIFCEAEVREKLAGRIDRMVARCRPERKPGERKRCRIVLARLRWEHAHPGEVG